MKNGFNFIDLFAGIGGFRLALEELGGKCVFSSEIDLKAQETYELNFNEKPFGDIREITSQVNSLQKIDELVPDHNFLAAGFPCQPFSLAGVSSRNSLGKAHGLMDKTKGTLFFDICRIVAAKRPEVLFLENVRNIVSHDKGKTFKVIMESLDYLGYSAFYKIVNAQTRVPQKRVRCFIVAFRDEINSFEFPSFDGDPIPLRSILEENVDDLYTLSDRGWAGHQRRTKRNLERGTGFTAFPAKLDKPANTLVARYYKDGKECLVPQEGKNPRMLTPRECARLQGFPEHFKIHPTRSAAYKQFGNSVPVPIIKEIASEILKVVPFENGRSFNKNRPVEKYVGDKIEEYETRATG